MNEDHIQVAHIHEVSAALAPTSEALKGGLILKLDAIQPITSNKELETAVETVREAKRFLALIEAARVKAKAPVLNLGKRIDEIAFNFCAAIHTAIIRLEGDKQSRAKGLIGVWQEKEQARIDAENARIEAERKEAERVAQEAIAEQERLAALSRPQAAKVVQAEVKAQAALANLAETKTQVAAPVTKVSGLKRDKVLNYEITDMRALYAVRPEWFDLVPKKSIIKASLVKGMNLPGLTVTEEFDSAIRR